MTVIEYKKIKAGSERRLIKLTCCHMNKDKSINFNAQLLGSGGAAFFFFATFQLLTVAQV